MFNRGKKKGKNSSSNWSDTPGCVRYGRKRNSPGGMKRHDRGETMYYQFQEKKEPEELPPGLHKHDTPMCLFCGAVNHWKVEPILRWFDIVIVLILLVAYGSGLLFLLLTIVFRWNPESRAKICPSCKKRSTWTFYY